MKNKMVTKRFIYADHAATSALDSEAFEAMREFLLDDFSNPSQPYSFARYARITLQKARDIVASCINADPEEIYFTSGGTESDNWAIKSVLTQHKRTGIITSNIEHHAILESCKYVEQFPNYSTKIIPVSQNGQIVPKALQELFQSAHETYMTSIMLANNEYGTIQPIKDLAMISHQNGAFFHTDAVQAVGHIKIDVKELNVDMLSASGHKFNGPKGVGFLFIKKGVDLPSYVNGGSQERGMRAGTENVASIIGLATALKNNCTKLQENIKHIVMLEETLLNKLHATNLDFICNSYGSHVPGNINLSFKGISGETLMHRLDLKGIMVSTGSACDSTKNQISHVIKALGIPDEYALGTIRISLGKENTLDDIDAICLAIEEIVPSLVRS
jgi:cysteine desulfurase